MIEEEFELLLEKTKEILITDINTDLKRLDSDIQVLELNQYSTDYELRYIKDGVRGLMIGLLITGAQFQDYDERHKWTMDVAEALKVAH